MCSRSRASTSSSTPSGRPMCSEPIPRWLWVATGTASSTRSISSSVKPSAASRSRERPATQLLGAGAGGHPLGLDAGQGARAALGDDRRSAQRVDLLGREARGGGRDRLRIAGGDRHLGAEAVLLLANLLGDLGGELLGAQRLAEDDVVDRLVDDLLEARHVDAGLARVEVDEALELGEEVAAGRSSPSGAPSTRITFSMPRTPTRVRLTSVAGRAGLNVGGAGCNGSLYRSSP